MGSWETVAGDLDSFSKFLPVLLLSLRRPSVWLTSTLRPSGFLRCTVHIIRHGSLDTLTPALLAPVSSELLATLHSRESTLLQEFAFSPAHDNPAQNKVLDDSPTTTGNVFELRSYRLKPGSMLEWEAAWRKGIEARRRFVVSSPASYSVFPVFHICDFSPPSQSNTFLTNYFLFSSTGTCRSLVHPSRQPAHSPPPLGVSLPLRPKGRPRSSVERQRLGRHGAGHGQARSGHELPDIGAFGVVAFEVRRGGIYRLRFYFPFRSAHTLHPPPPPAHRCTLLVLLKAVQ